MKIHNQFIISLSALSLFCYTDALAQSKGRIVDAQGEGIAFANVVHYQRPTLRLWLHV